MENKPRIVLFDVGILGISILNQLKENKNISITVVDDKKISYQDVSSNAYPKKFFGQLRVDVLKEKMDSIQFLNKMDEDDFSWDLMILASDNFDLEKSNLINQLALKKNVKLVMTRIIDNHLGEIGPLIIPQQTACFKCYESRIRANLEDAEKYFGSKISLGDSEKLFQLTALRKIMSSLVELETLRIISDKKPRFADIVLSIDLNNNSMSADRIFKIPNCPVCD